MKRCIRTMEVQEEFQQKQKRNSSSRMWMLTTLLHLCIMALLVFVAVNMRVRYSQKAETLARECARIRQEIHLEDRSIDNLRLHRERLSTYPYINGRNESLKLGLRPAIPRQIRTTALIRRNAAPAGRTQDRRTASVR